jgi:segregation and condensation protein B
MEQVELKPIVESMIFVAEEPITINVLWSAFEGTEVTKELLKETLGVIETDWNNNDERGIQLSQVAGGYQFRTKEANAAWLKKLNIPKPMRLSGPALETLAIVAYRQPMVRSEIEEIRGVDSGGVLKTLLERRLLRIIGRRDEAGQPLLYGTTKEFLEVFNLKTLKELPTLKDIEELARERRAEMGLDVTEVIRNEEDEEEATEVIQRKSIDDDEDNEKDQEALQGLESSLKNLRKLEKRVFPKEKVLTVGGENADTAGNEKTAGEAVDGTKELESQPAEGAESTDLAQETAADDATSEDDRAL